MDLYKVIMFKVVVRYSRYIVQAKRDRPRQFRPFNIFCNNAVGGLGAGGRGK